MPSPPGAARRRFPYLLGDFASQASVRALSRTPCAPASIVSTSSSTTLGGVHKARQVTVDGIEATFAVNHLGYFLLTNLLLDLVVKSAPARVVTVASVGHRRGTLDSRGPRVRRGGYSIMRAYGRSKLANDLVRERARAPAGRHRGHFEQPASGLAWTRTSGRARPCGRSPSSSSCSGRSSSAPRRAGSGSCSSRASPRARGCDREVLRERPARGSAPLARDASLATRLWDVNARGW